VKGNAGYTNMMTSACEFTYWIHINIVYGAHSNIAIQKKINIKLQESSLEWS